MYRGHPQPPVRDCKACNGTGTIMGIGPWDRDTCSSCNGTGIAGNLRYLGILLIGWLVFCAVIIYLIVR